MTVLDAIANGTIPHSLHQLFPTICSCNTHLEVNDSLTELYCPNPTCPLHMGSRTETMLKQLNVADFGLQTCVTLVKENNLANHTQVLLLPKENMPSRNKDNIKEKLHSQIQESLLKPKSLSDLARLMRCRDMQSACYPIFEKYDNIDEFYKDYQYSEDFISEHMNLKKGITTAKFNSYLTLNEPILRGLATLFPIKKVAKDTIRVCMTGGLDSARRPDGTVYKSREIFLKEMADLLEGILNIEEKSSLSQKVNILITDTPFSGTGKNKKADMYKVVKMTFADFQTKCYNIKNDYANNQQQNKNIIDN